MKFDTILSICEIAFAFIILAWILFVVWYFKIDGDSASGFAILAVIMWFFSFPISLKIASWLSKE